MKNDQVKNCFVHKIVGCSHVDGFLCDFPKCEILTNGFKTIIFESQKNVNEYNRLYSNENNIAILGDVRNIFGKNFDEVYLSQDITKNYTKIKDYLIRHSNKFFEF